MAAKHAVHQIPKSPSRILDVSPAEQQRGRLSAGYAVYILLHCHFPRGTRASRPLRRRTADIVLRPPISVPTVRAGVTDLHRWACACRTLSAPKIRGWSERFKSLPETFARAKRWYLLQPQLRQVRSYTRLARSRLVVAIPTHRTSSTPPFHSHPLLKKLEPCPTRHMAYRELRTGKAMRENCEHGDKRLLRERGKKRGANSITHKANAKVRERRGETAD